MNLWLPVVLPLAVIACGLLGFALGRYANQRERRRVLDRANVARTVRAATRTARQNQRSGRGSCRG